MTDWSAIWVFLGSMPGWVHRCLLLVSVVAGAWSVWRVWRQARQNEREDQKIAALHYEIERSQLTQGPEKALALVQDAYEEQMKQLDAEQAVRAEQLKADPASLARFLQSVSERRPC